MRWSPRLVLRKLEEANGRPEILLGRYPFEMVTWVLLAGLPGTGKSTLAKALERRVHAATLDKDRVREALFPGPLTDYTQEQDDLCIRAMLEAAVYLTGRQRVDFVLFDGRAFSRQIQIETVINAAERVGAHWKIAHLSCADEVAEARLRHNDPSHPARNRDAALYHRVKREFEPILHQKFDADTTDGVDAIVDPVVNYLMRDR